MPSPTSALGLHSQAPSAAGRNHGSAESVWLSSEGLDVLRSLSNSLHFICVSKQYAPLVLHRVKH